MDVVVERLRAMIADHGKPAEVNADGEFGNKTFNRFLSQRNVAARFKEGRQDLATLDAAMNSFKKMTKKMMQQETPRNGPGCYQRPRGHIIDSRTKP